MVSALDRLHYTSRLAQDRNGWFGADTAHVQFFALMVCNIMQANKERFLNVHANIYGYNGTIDTIRKNEFHQLKDITYLDHVGATLYSKSQIESYTADLQKCIYGNPHSGNASSQRTSDLIEEARHLIARHFNTTLEKHHVIFTSSATGALKIVAENFDWSKESSFVFLQDSHTSVVGIREIAKRDGACVVCLSEGELGPFLADHTSKKTLESGNELDTHKGGEQETFEALKAGYEISNLFSYPAMSNFCGRKYTFEWISLIKQRNHSLSSQGNGRWYVLLDAASCVGTNPLDLSEVEADFIPISFYKMFGFPTGIGALIVKADAISSLKPKCYYGGGTVLSTISSIDHHVLKNEVSDRYEDGTLPFLDIVALKHGFYWLKAFTGSMQLIKVHTFSLAQYTATEMKQMVHYNGVSLCKLYHDNDYCDCDLQGPIINFNIINVNGDYVGYSQVEKLANLSKIHVRTGCFCNTGDCQKHLGLTSDEMLSNYNAGHVCGDQMDIINGKPTGSVRISFGYMSTFEDAWMFINFLRDCFLVSDTDAYVDLATCHSVPVDDERKGKEKVLNVVTNTDPEHEQKEIMQENISIEVLSKMKESRNRVKDGGENHPRKSDQLSSDSKDSQRSPFDEAIKQEHSTDEDSSKYTLKDTKYTPNSTSSLSTRQSRGHLLRRIFVYPVKSCGSFEVSKWWIGEKGFLFDREWMVVSEYGSVLTQKKEPRMVFIKPFIDIANRVLLLKCEGFDDISVPLDTNVEIPVNAVDRQSCSSKVCGEKVSCDDCGDEVAAWMEEVLGKPCRLVRQSAEQRRMVKKKNSESDYDKNASDQHRISLANESQYLLISEVSLLEIFKKFKRSKSLIKLEELAESFRANFVIDGDIAFEEDNWTEVRIRNLDFKVTGKCQRCQMICINQNTAEKNREPLETLVRVRGSRMEFGIYLVSCNASDGEHIIQIGDKIIPVA